MDAGIILGYDIESANENTKGFLEGASELHSKHSVPWTIYLTGQTVERRTQDITNIMDDPLVSIGQHTYSHILLKSIYMRPGDGKPIHDAFPNFFKKGVSLEEINEEITKTQRIMQDLLGIECRGLTGPWGYSRGLMDRPDILEIIHKNGIKWIRTNARDLRDCQPLPFEEQPFFYTDQGFPDILELGVQGFQDDFYWERFGDRKFGDTYHDYLIGMLDQILEKGWIWNICSHDHGTSSKEVFYKTKGIWIEKLIIRTKEIGLRFISPEELYREMQAAGSN